MQQQRKYPPKLQNYMANSKSTGCTLLLVIDSSFSLEYSQKILATLFFLVLGIEAYH